LAVYRIDGHAVGRATAELGCAHQVELLEVLRHTCCSHLAVKGAAPKAIHELVGDSTLSMTLRYVHLAPSALCEARLWVAGGQCSERCGLK
jgi:site-specific recombinase XerD